MARSPSRRQRPRLLLLAAFVSGQALIGCPCVRNSVNDSEGTRWYLFSRVAVQHICPELLNTGVPLAVPMAGPSSVGRFFPSQCNVHVDEGNKVIVVNLAGTGYASLPAVRRVGFYASMSVEYRPDFHLFSDSIYVWGRFSRNVSPPNIQLLGTENAAVGIAYQTPFGSVADLIGNGIFQSSIGRGFTVVRQGDGDDFALDILNPPAKPLRQFNPGDGAKLLASDRTEVPPAARQYLGPYTVPGNGQRLTFQYRLEGAPLSWYLVDRQNGNDWVQNYESGRALSGPRGPILASGQLAVGSGSVPIPVPRGSYMLVVENSAAAPLIPVAVPLPLPLPGVAGSTSATLSYTTDVADR